MPIPESQLMSLSLYNRHFLITSLVALTALDCQKEPSADPSQGTSAGTLPSATPVVPAAAATESDKTSADPPRADDSPEIATGAAAASAAPAANDRSPKYKATAPAAGKNIQGTKRSGDGFATWLEGTGPFVVGKNSSLRAVLASKKPYKCNEEYPYKLKLQANPQLGLTESTIRGMKISGANAQLNIPVVPKTAGKTTLRGKLYFSVCTDDRCLIERQDISLALNVE